MTDMEILKSGSSSTDRQYNNRDYNYPYHFLTMKLTEGNKADNPNNKPDTPIREPRATKYSTASPICSK